MVPGRRDRRSLSVAVRRTFGAEIELEEGKIGRGRRIQTQITKKKPLSKHEFESRRVRVRQPKLHRRNALDACTSACSGLTLDRSCSACNTASATSPAGLPQGFFVGLKDSVA